MSASDGLAHVIDELSSLLPAQGPISIFIHHNTLHAFEDLTFEDAVERAAARFGCEPFLPEARYRDKLAAGRIRTKDVEALLREQLGDEGGADVAGLGPRVDLWRAVVLHGIPPARGRELAWILEETPALSTFRTDVPANALRSGGSRDVRRLWDACVEAIGRADPAAVTRREPPVRHRDWLREACGLDTDSWFHPSLIRFLAGYLDQGLSHWAM